MLLAGVVWGGGGFCFRVDDDEENPKMAWGRVGGEYSFSTKYHSIFMLSYSRAHVFVSMMVQ